MIGYEHRALASPIKMNLVVRVALNEVITGDS
jgi:hypothetical protein